MAADADKAAADAAAAAAAANNGGTSSAVSPLVIPSTSSYVFLTLLLFPFMIAAYATVLDELGSHLPSCNMSNLHMLVNLGNCYVMFFTWIKLMRKLLLIST
jgi:hypothetical protein